MLVSHSKKPLLSHTLSLTVERNVSRHWGRGLISPNFSGGVLLCGHLGSLPNHTHREESRTWNCRQCGLPNLMGLDKKKEPLHQPALLLLCQHSHTCCAPGQVSRATGGKQSAPASIFTSPLSPTSLSPISPLTCPLPAHNRQISLCVSWKKNMITGKLFLECLELDSKMS